MTKEHLVKINLIEELIKNQKEYCVTNPIRLSLAKLPDKIWLKYIAYYLAVSVKTYGEYDGHGNLITAYTNYDDVNYDNRKIINNGRSIHNLLLEKLGEILDIRLNDRSLMLPSHRKIADEAGIISIAMIATYPKRDRPDDWSVKVTKELLLKLLKSIPEFNYLFEINNVEEK